MYDVFLSKFIELQFLSTKHLKIIEVGLSSNILSKIKHLKEKMRAK